MSGRPKQRESKPVAIATDLAEDASHLKGPCGVHVGSDDGDASVGLLGVAECESSLELHLVERQFPRCCHGNQELKLVTVFISNHAVSV